jgi:hypothetical protein
MHGSYMVTYQMAFSWLVASNRSNPTQRGGGEDQGAAMRAAATVVPTVDREGRSEAASAAAGAAGKRSENILQQRKLSDILMVIF